MRCFHCPLRPEMRMCLSFGREHHWQCDVCRAIVMVADRLGKSDRDVFYHDEDPPEEETHAEHMNIEAVMDDDS